MNSGSQDTRTDDAQVLWTISTASGIRGLESGSRFIHSHSIPWQATEHKGFWIKPLYEDAERGEKTMLMKVDPGAFAPSHMHPGELEQVYVLEGSFQDESGVLRRGDFCGRAPNAAHSTGSETGCIVLLVYTRR